MRKYLLIIGFFFLLQSPEDSVAQYDDIQNQIEQNQEITSKIYERLRKIKNRNQEFYTGTPSNSSRLYVEKSCLEMTLEDIYSIVAATAHIYNEKECPDLECYHDFDCSTDDLSCNCVLRNLPDAICGKIDPDSLNEICNTCLDTTLFFRPGRLDSLFRFPYEVSAKILTLEQLEISGPFSQEKDSTFYQSLREYDEALRTFARRCSRFLQLSHISCRENNYINEPDLNRIDFAIASLEVRRAEILDYINKVELRNGQLQIIDSIKVSEQRIIDSIKSSAPPIADTSHPHGMDVLDGAFNFHYGLPSNFGLSMTWFQHELLAFDYQLGLSGLVMLNNEAGDFLWGGQAGIVSRRFGGRMGLVFNTNDEENSYSLLASLIFRDRNFLYSVDISEYFVGFSIGHGVIWDNKRRKFDVRAPERDR